MVVENRTLSYETQRVRHSESGSIEGQAMARAADLLLSDVCLSWLWWLNKSWVGRSDGRMAAITTKLHFLSLYLTSSSLTAAAAAVISTLETTNSVRRRSFPLRFLPLSRWV